MSRECERRCVQNGQPRLHGRPAGRPVTLIEREGLWFCSDRCWHVFQHTARQAAEYRRQRSEERAHRQRALERELERTRRYEQRWMEKQRIRYTVQLSEQLPVGRLNFHGEYSSILAIPVTITVPEPQLTVTISFGDSEETFPVAPPLVAPKTRPTTVTITFGDIEATIPAAAYQPKVESAEQQSLHTQTPGTIAFGDIVVPTRPTEIVAAPAIAELNDGGAAVLPNAGASPGSATTINGEYAWMFFPLPPGLP